MQWIVLAGAVAFAFLTIGFTVGRSWHLIVAALRGQSVAAQTPASERWRHVHLAGDRHDVFHVSEPDRPFWRPLWIEKR